MGFLSFRLMGCFLFALIASPDAAFAVVNLVPNSGFESFTPQGSADDCKGAYRETLNERAAPWFGVSTDYYLDCGKDSRGLQKWGYPQNSFGNQLARVHSEGTPNRAYAGFANFASQYWEYPTVKLLHPLYQGIRYEGSFWVSMGSGLPYYGNGFIQSIDMLLTANPGPSEDRKAILPCISFGDVHPQVIGSNDPTGSMFLDSKGNPIFESWIQVKDEFIANGDEQYAQIGAYHRNMVVKEPGLSAEGTLNYYYLDDVSVSCMPHPGLRLSGASKVVGEVNAFCAPDEVVLDASDSWNLVFGKWVFQEVDSEGKLVFGGAYAEEIARNAINNSIQSMKLSDFSADTISKFRGKFVKITLMGACDQEFLPSASFVVHFPEVNFTVQDQVCTEKFPVALNTKDPLHLLTSYTWTINRIHGGAPWVGTSSPQSTFPAVDDLNVAFSSSEIHAIGKYNLELNAQCVSGAALKSSSTYQVKAPGPIVWKHDSTTDLLHSLKFELVEPVKTASIRWDFTQSINPLQVDTQMNQRMVSHSYTKEGDLPVKLTVEYTQGCKAEVSDTIHVHLDSVFFPNAFTPTGDGLNDFFKPGGTDTLVTQFTVFNRWGQIVYNEPLAAPRPVQELRGWDGNTNGTSAPAEVYFYTIAFQPSIDPGLNLAPGMKPSPIVIPQKTFTLLR